MKNTATLFTPFSANGFEVSNRIVMAPMTRARSEAGDVITPLAANYYGQRATAGLIISEGVPVSEAARGYVKTPGLYTEAQVVGWKPVTAAVHAKGGKIFAQLWHVGRRATTETTGGSAPLAPSATKIPDKVYGTLVDGSLGMVETDMPIAMSLEAITSTQEDFVRAAELALEAGFDGVEIHGAHGYLFDQFMRSDANHRSDDYGGNTANRTRFTLETVQKVVAAIGAHRVGLRISPFLSEGDSTDPTMPETALYLMEQLNPLQLAYVHLSENVANFREIPDSYRDKLRARYQYPIIVCGNYTQEKATRILEKNWADMVAFGRPFIVNPDLVLRMKNGYPLREVSETASSSFYGGGAQGYIDYDTYNE